MYRMMTMALAIAALGVPALAAKPNGDPASAPERVADAPDRVICKRYVETGSLVRVRKVCGTKRDWEIKREELHSLGAMNSCRLTSENGGC